jgi:hypothetical protein
LFSWGTVRGWTIIGIVLLFWHVRAGALAEQELRSIPDLRLSLDEAQSIPGTSGREAPGFLDLLFGTRLASNPRHQRYHLDVNPLLDSMLALVRDVGIPLRDYREEKDGELIGVSASFRVSERLPAVRFHIGEHAPEPLGAFYSTKSDVNWAFSIPLRRQLTMRIEGGDQSEFGYYAIAGLQWRDPARPIAVGMGVPILMRDAEGSVGVIIQYRMELP